MTEQLWILSTETIWKEPRKNLRRYTWCQCEFYTTTPAFFGGTVQEMSLKSVNGLGLGHKLGEHKLKFQPAKF